MEIVASLFATAATAAPAAAATTATAATAAATAAGWTTTVVGTASTASSALSVLQGVATAGSLITQLAATRNQMRQEDLASKQEALNIQREYIQKVGANRVAFAGSGLSLGSGQSEAIEDSLAEQRDFEDEISRTNGRMRINAAALKGAGGLINTAGNFAIDLAKRG